MFDETKLFGLLGRIDERTTITQEQVVNIFERLGELEKKSPMCPQHEALVNSVSSTKIDVKANDVKLIFVTSSLATLGAILVTWMINNLPIS